jgi:hypothetical protein
MIKRILHLIDEEIFITIIHKAGEREKHFYVSHEERTNEREKD